MASCITDPATTNETTPRATLGGIYEFNGKFHKYVRFLDAVAYVAGHICEWANAAGTSVTNDVSGGSSLGRAPAGIAPMVMTQNNYGYIQVSGVATVVTDGSVAAGEAVVADGGADGVGDTMAAGEEHQVIGYALEADSGSPATCRVALCNLI